ncbi:MAG: hypothetical protein ACOY3I_07720 [Verrucomicrobiota bacterium]
MPKIDAENAEVGMVLASDVQNLNGQLLMPKGMALAEKHLWLLKTWGIQHIDIISKEGAVSAANQELSEEEIRRYTPGLREIFGGAEENDLWMQELFKLCLERKILKWRVSHGDA